MGEGRRDAGARRIVLAARREDASGVERSRRSEEGNYQFLPNAVRLVSSSISKRDDFVSYVGNSFSIFSSLSSINLLSHQ
jgi:hypothetical protein